MELVDRGLLTAEQTGGFLPSWGDGEAMLEAVDMIAHCRGFGEKMAQGSKRISQWVGQGSDDVPGRGQGAGVPHARAAHQGGLGPRLCGRAGRRGPHDEHPRRRVLEPGGSLDRVRAVYPAEPMPVTALDEKKVELFYHEVNWKHFMDCAVVCIFYPYNYVQLAEALSGATGHDYTAEEILRVGERAQHLCRLFNLREGLTAADDRLPEADHAAVHGRAGGRASKSREESFLSAPAAVVRPDGLDGGGRADRGAAGRARAGGTPQPTDRLGFHRLQERAGSLQSSSRPAFSLSPRKSGR